MACWRRLAQLQRVKALTHFAPALRSPVVIFHYQHSMQIHAMSSDSEILEVPEFLNSVFATPDLGTIATEVKCKRFCCYYRNLDSATRPQFLSYLAQHFSINQDNVIQTAHALTSAQERGEAFLVKCMERMRSAMAPRYQNLFQQIGRIEGGVKFLVDMRADLLNFLTESTSELDTAHFQALNRLLRELLTLWFAVGFLELQRVTWQSPCDLVQKISDYEAVHPIRSWTDLKQRVGPYRRCYTFTHSSMPREPVVVLHTALTNEISNNIHAIIHNPRFRAVTSASEQLEPDNNSMDLFDNEDPVQISTAVFYSITSTQKGLQGVELGNYLIKRVVRELQSEFPCMVQFSSLSPVPGFRDWLIGLINLQLHRSDIGEEDENQQILTQSELESIKAFRQSHHPSTLETFKQLIQTNKWLSQPDMVAAMKGLLLRLCARYLYQEKRRGFALNPVANFHLTNGAVLWRINYLADTSIRGLSQSCGLMVNYRYYLNDCEDNSNTYLRHQRIAVSPAVLDLLGGQPSSDQHSTDSQQ